MTDEQQAAIWYWRYGHLDVEMFDDEEHAASYAVSMADEGEASIVGVQLRDGTALRRDEWPAYKAESDRREALWREESRRAATQPKPVMRHITSPFPNRDGTHATTDVNVDLVPAWVGRHTTEDSQ